MARQEAPLARILETVLYVEDLDAARTFYGEVLGLTIDSEKAGSFLFLKLEQGMLLLFEPHGARRKSVPPPHGALGPGHACFAVAERELERWKDRLASHDVVIEHEQTWPRGGRSFYFRDPAGNSLEIATPRIWGFVE